MRGFLLPLAFGGRLGSHLSSDHVFEAADHFWTLGPLVVLASSQNEIILGFSLVLALHLMNKFVLDLVGRLHSSVVLSI